jgi:hypothetical protein
MQTVPESEAELYHVHFTTPDDSRGPYVQRLIDYELTPTGGHITFDGYYYIEDSDLPKILTLDFSKREEKPYKVVNGGHHYHFEFNYAAEVEIHEREIIKITDAISTIEDDDGEEMRVCFFPTRIQRLHFSVIKLLNICEGFERGELVCGYGEITSDK